MILSINLQGDVSKLGDFKMGRSGRGFVLGDNDDVYVFIVQCLSQGVC